ncbi:MAG: hypothetical protein RPR97_10550 [Colwellia sp.]|jgi:hypothetical protein
MTESEMINIALRISEQIDFLWNFYVTACAILLGWIFSSRIKWDYDRQRTVIILFILFAAVNLSAIYNEYYLFEMILKDLSNNLQAHDDGFIREFSDSRGIGSIGSAVVHIGADIFIYSLLTRCFNSSIKDT